MTHNDNNLGPEGKKNDDEYVAGFFGVTTLVCGVLYSAAMGRVGGLEVDRMATNQEYSRTLEAKQDEINRLAAANQKYSGTLEAKQDEINRLKEERDLLAGDLRRMKHDMLDLQENAKANDTQKQNTQKDEKRLFIATLPPQPDEREVTRLVSTNLVKAN